MKSCQFSGICLFSTMRRHGAVEHLPQTMGQEGTLSQFRTPRLFFQMSGHTTYVSVLFPHHLTEPLGLYLQPSYTASSAHRSGGQSDLWRITLFMYPSSFQISGPLGLPSFEVTNLPIHSPYVGHKGNDWYWQLGSVHNFSVPLYL